MCYQKSIKFILSCSLEQGKQNVRIAQKDVNGSLIWFRVYGNINAAESQAKIFGKAIYQICSQKGAFKIYGDTDVISSFQVFSPLWLITKLNETKNFDTRK